MGSTLVWFRQDFRLADNLALNAAIRRGGTVIPVFIADDAAEGRWPLGTRAREWRDRSLMALDGALRERGSKLVRRSGDTLQALLHLARETGADAVMWNKRYEPHAERHEASIANGLKQADVKAVSHSGALLFDPHEIRNKQGKPYQVFTPFWRHCSELQVAPAVKLAKQSLPAPPRWPALEDQHRSEAAENTDRDSAGPTFEPGEAGAAKRLREFLRTNVDAYSEARDIPSISGTSQLSPHLRFGEITPRQIWAAVAATSRDTGVFPPSTGAAVFLKELGWREFAYHILANFPETPERPLRANFDRFRWADDPDGARWRAWTTGRTGYPIVDAGMRELNETGWMHNRVRMIVASFLVKHLRLPWARGAQHFWQTLADADLANNTLGWQWSAGCGADAAPYFRIFAPVAQGGKFDPDGAYVRKWVPELAELPTRFVHSPWTAPSAVLSAAGVGLGQNYPMPIVDHARARAEALEAFRGLRVE